MSTGLPAKKIRGNIKTRFGRPGRIRKGKIVLLHYKASWQEALTLCKARADGFSALRADVAKR